MIGVFTVDGDMVNRCEVFDEAALDAAIARFEQLSRPAPRLENAASRPTRALLRTSRRATGTLPLRFWPTIITATIGGGSPAPESAAAGMPRSRTFGWSPISGPNITVEVIATRGDRLVLTRTRARARRQAATRSIAELLGLIETDLQGRIAAVIELDLDDFDAAIEELDARYLAGEAAAHARTWSLITGSYASINRHEQPATTTDWVNVDHRRETAMGPGDLIAYLRRRAGPGPRQQGLCRGRASADRPRSRCHLRSIWDLASGI